MSEEEDRPPPPFSLPRWSMRDILEPRLLSFATTNDEDASTSSPVASSSSSQTTSTVVRLGLILLHGSWNTTAPTDTSTTSCTSAAAAAAAAATRRMLCRDHLMRRLYQATLVANYGDHSSSRRVDDDSVSESASSVFLGHVIVDESEESLELLLSGGEQPLPPGELPALVYVLQTITTTQESANNDTTEEKVLLRYIPVRTADLRQALSVPESASFSSKRAFAPVLHAARTALEQLQNEYSWVDDLLMDQQRSNQQNTTHSSSSAALRIFIAGDRSSVGKSSVCLGLLGQLLQQGVPPERLAYMKPATQSESPPLLQPYCQHHGIHCVPIGPLVYYRGFTRAYLAGETDTSEELLQRCANAVDRLARGKDVVILDGVGFPAVGSICGTSNADVARVCGYPVAVSSSDSSIEPQIQQRRPLGVCLVGGGGVGAAVDAFNLNATYFQQAGIPVLGAIFNKLAATGFYSLENCRTQVTSYFDQNLEQNAKGRRPFGFVPLFAPIAGPNALSYVEEFIRMFGEHVDVPAILEAARRIQQDKTLPAVSGSDPTTATNCEQRVAKRPKLETSAFGKALPLRSREEIEAMAIQMGAAPSA